MVVKWGEINREVNLNGIVLGWAHTSSRRYRYGA
jgi:hypothetical protein